MSEGFSEKDEKFAFAFFSERAAYHHHKEQMAYVGFLVQTAFFTAIMTFKWDFINGGVHALVVILSIIFWALIHLFLRWQLRLRRYAALQHAAVLNAILKDTQNNKNIVSNNEKDSNEKSKSKYKTSWSSKLIDWIFWPCPKVLPFLDIDLDKYPDWYQTGFKSQYEKGTGAYIGEIIVTIGSWIILVRIVLRLAIFSC